MPIWEAEAPLFIRGVTARGPVDRTAALMRHGKMRCVVSGPGATAVLEESYRRHHGEIPPFLLWDGTRSDAPCGAIWRDGGVCTVPSLATVRASDTVTVETEPYLPAALKEEFAAQNILIEQRKTAAISHLKAAKRLLCRRKAAATKATIDRARIGRYAARLFAREYLASSGEPPCDPPRSLPAALSAITPNGVCVRYDTLCALCPRIYVIEDPIGTVSALLLRELSVRFRAVRRCLLGYCPVTGQLDHLLLPELGVGFTHSNEWHTVDFPVYRRIPAGRFGETGYSSVLFSADEIAHAVTDRLNRAVALLADADALSRHQETTAAAYLTASAAFNERLIHLPL